MMTSRSLLAAALVAAHVGAAPLQATGLQDGPPRNIPLQLVTADGDRLEVRLSLDQQKRRGYVEICLQNRTETSVPLAFDLASVEKPRFRVTTKSGECGRFAPVQQSFDLWKGPAGPNAVPTLRIQLDLARYRGRRLDIHWLKTVD